MLAPIILFVYNRFSHTKQTLDALKQNTLAKQSQIFVFSDGPKNQEDSEKVGRVRKLINHYQNAFATMEVVCAVRNQGLANSVIAGVSQIIRRTDKVIVLEDDLVTSPYFLSYMNQVLDYYEDNPAIWSVSGYTPPLRCLQKYDRDVYLAYRGCSWGWGTWKDRWDTVDWALPDYLSFRTDKKQIRNFERGGKDLPLMLERQMNGRLDSWAVRWCYWQSKYDMLTVYPTISLLDNIGCDGSGTHDTNADVYGARQTERREKNYDLSGIKIEKKIVKEFYETYSATLSFRIRKKLQKLSGKRTREKSQ